MAATTLDHEALADRGFTTCGLLKRRELRRLTRRWTKLGVPADENYYASSVHAPRAMARAIDQELKASIDPRLDALAPGMTTFLAAYIAKGAGGGDVDLHPDWTYTDERRSRALVFWCPLVDTDSTNGAMHVLPGTHRLLDGLRGSGDFPSPVAEIDAATLTAHTVTVALEAGEAIVWDAALIHGSGPNPTGEPRPAVALARAPTDAALVHFHREPGAAIEGYTIDESYFTTDDFGTAPTKGEPITPWAGAVDQLAVADLADITATG